jgi:hypothetical protein
MEVYQNFQTKCWLAKYHYTGSKPANHGGGGIEKIGGGGEKGEEGEGKTGGKRG